MSETLQPKRPADRPILGNSDQMGLKQIANHTLLFSQQLYFNIVFHIELQSWSSGWVSVGTAQQNIGEFMIM